MIINIKEEDRKDYYHLQEQLAIEKIKLANLLEYYEKNKEVLFNKMGYINQRLKDNVHRLIRKYKLKKKKILDVNMDAGFIKIEDKK